MQQTTMQDLQDALEYVSADVARDDWVRVLMGIKNEFGADAFDVADSWSQTGGTYNKDNFKSTWQNIDAVGGTTIATVFKLAINNGYKPDKKELTPEDKARFLKEKQARNTARAEQEAKAKAEREQWQQVIANASIKIIDQCTIAIKSNKYLSAKKVNAYGVFGVKTNFIFVVKPNFDYQLIFGGSNIKQFFDDLPSKDNRDFSFLHIKRGDLVVPLIDTDKKLWNVQIINATGTKLFLKHGKKSGCFHFIGKTNSCNVVAIAEGYATAASIHMATSLPCAVALDAGNLAPVAKALKAKLPDKQFVFCADNDINTAGNPGVTKANLAANFVGGVVAVPDFSAVQAKAA